MYFITIHILKIKIRIERYSIIIGLILFLHYSIGISHGVFVFLALFLGKRRELAVVTLNVRITVNCYEH
jgi:hypothetical protein